MNKMIKKTVEFLRKIGFEVVYLPGASGFIDGIRIVDGALHVDPQCQPSALLHEAGHLAIIPAEFRSHMNDDLEIGINKMFDEISNRQLDPDHPLQVAAIQCSDCEATAWAWAAGVAVGLKPEEIIQNNEYENTGRDIRMMLQVGKYFGIHGLARSGMCKIGPGSIPEQRFPVMQYWLQTA